MSTITPPITISRDDFRQAVRRNIRSLLAMTNVEQQDLAPVVGLNKSQLSDRLTCQTAWKDEELLNVAQAFHVPHSAVVAITVEEFQESLAGTSPVFHDLSQPDQGVLFLLAA
jgi:predicted Mrr-cat superfamily restriction endonuclease